MSVAAPPEVSRSWRPGVAGIDEVFHASFTAHAYPFHTHDTWTVLLLDRGTVRYEIDRHERGADRRQVTVLPPHVAHDGRSAHVGHGFTKRVLYLDAATIGEGLVGRAVDTSTIDDLQLRRSVARLHHLLDGPIDPLAATSQLAFVAESITGHLAGAGPAGGAASPSARSSSDAAEALRARLDGDLTAQHDLGVLAGELGWSATHLIRSFGDEYGLPPHQYLIGRRIAAARRLLLDGVPPATVAAEVGFHDQSHLHRHFRRHVGTTPARYQRS